MQKALFYGLILGACQPIMIGNPGGGAGDANQVGGSSTASDGSGGAGNASGAATTSGAAAHAGGAAFGGRASGGTASGAAGAGVVGGAPDVNAGGSAPGGAAGESGEAGAVNEAAPGVIQARVLFVIYDPLMTGVTDPAKPLSSTLGVSLPNVLGKQLATTLETLTQGHVHHQLIEPVMSSASFPPTLDAFRYDAASYNACLLDAKACHAATVDYDAVQVEQDLCALADSQNADQIWLFGAKRFGFAMGQQLKCKAVTDGQTIDRTIDFINLDYSEGLPSLLTSYQAQAEYALQEALGSPPANATDEASHWLANVPRARWSNRQNRLNDYWRYILHPLERDAPADVSVSCSSSYLPGWCAQAMDGDHGVCNLHEWATYMEPTGFVEYRFAPPRLVSNVDLYDRACDEQVLAGHIEFSDGSPDITFSELETTGTQALSVPFEPKLLTGLRVVIDESSQPTIADTKANPGFGDVTVSSRLP